MTKFKVGDKVKYVNDSGREYFGEVLSADRQSDLIVGLKGYNGHSCAVTYPDLFDYIQQRGYLGECVHLESTKLELVEEKKTTPFELLLNHWGIEVGENFNIEGERYNPYYFGYDGYLYDCCDDDAQYQFAKLLTGKRKIQKIETREMTIAEIEKELGYAIKVVKED